MNLDSTWSTRCTCLPAYWMMMMVYQLCVNTFKSIKYINSCTQVESTRTKHSPLHLLQKKQMLRAIRHSIKKERNKKQKKWEFQSVWLCVVYFAAKLCCCQHYLVFHISVYNLFNAKIDAFKYKLREMSRCCFAFVQLLVQPSPPTPGKIKWTRKIVCHSAHGKIHFDRCNWLRLRCTAK